MNIQYNGSKAIHISKYNFEFQQMLFYTITQNGQNKFITLDLSCWRGISFKEDFSDQYIYQGFSSGENPLFILKEYLPDSKHIADSYIVDKFLNYSENYLLFTMPLDSFLEFDKIMNLYNMAIKSKDKVFECKLNPKEMFYVCDNFICNNQKGRTELNIRDIDFSVKPGQYFTTKKFFSI